MRYKGTVTSSCLRGRRRLTKEVKGKSELVSSYETPSHSI
jgi:hypothetical protein